MDYRAALQHRWAVDSHLPQYHIVRMKDVMQGPASHVITMMRQHVMVTWEKKRNEAA